MTAKAPHLAWELVGAWCDVAFEVGVFGRVRNCAFALRQTVTALADGEELRLQRLWSPLVDGGVDVGWHLQDLREFRDMSALSVHRLWVKTAH